MYGSKDLQLMKSLVNINKYRIFIKAFLKHHQKKTMKVILI